jgi:hypothetical protein
MALRLGFDRNEVVFHSIKWHNPPAFQDTPYFLTIQEVVVKFDILACLGALYNHKEYVAHVHTVELDNVEVNILKLRPKGKGRESEKEKADSGSKSSINFWCALGEVDEEEVPDKEDYSSRVGNYVSSLMDSIHHSIGSSKPSSSSPSHQNSSHSLVGAGGGGGASEHRDSLLNRFHCKSHSNHSESSKGHDSTVHHDSRSSVKDDNDALDAARRVDEEHETTGKKSSFTEKVGMSLLSVSRHMHLDKGSKTNTTLNPSNPASSGSSAKVDHTDSDANSDDDIECSAFPGVEAVKAESQQNAEVESNSEPTPATPARQKKKKSPHMGIKYKFQVDQLILKDLKVHAQDFLYATHCESSDSKTIKLAALVFDYKQLNKRDEKEKEEKDKEEKDKVKEKQKEKEKHKSHFGLCSSQKLKKESVSDIDDLKGSYADEILHRIINVLSYEILSKNKLSLASNLFGAAANHTASAVRDAATSAKRGVVESVTAHNKELFNIANRALSKHPKVRPLHTIFHIFKSE